MFTKGKVSICLLTYNRPNLIKLLLESILKQTYSNFEIIITDNSDNLETMEIVKQFNDCRIRYFKNEKNLGMGGNAIKSFGLVTGEYFTFTPDDDLWIDKDKLAKQVSILNSYPEINIVYSNADSIDYNGVILDEFASIYKELDFDIILAKELLPGAYTKYFLNILTACLRSKALLNIFKESFNFNSEEYLCYYIACTNNNIGFVYKKLVALREAEHHRTIVINGKVVDYKDKKELRIKQILSIYDNLINKHPDVIPKLRTNQVQTFLANNIFFESLSSRDLILVIKTILDIYKHFRYANFIHVIKKPKSIGKSFG